MIDAFYWHSKQVQSGVVLGLRVAPTGRKRFVCKYRPVGGRRDVTKRFTLTAATLQDAEREAKRLFRASSDPARAQREERIAETLAEVVPLYLAELAGTRKPNTIYEWTRILGGTYNGVTHRGYVLPTLGSTRVRQINETAVAALHRRIRNGKDGEQPVMANRVVAVLSSLFKWCEKRGLRDRDTNPARDIERYPERALERYLSGEELSRLSDSLKTAETIGLVPATKYRRASKNANKAKHRPKSADTPRRADPVAVAAIRFLMLTGFREQEVLSLRWDAIDSARGVVTLADTKTGRSRRPLGAAARDLLATLPHDGEYVFPGAVPGAPRKEIRRVWYAVREAAALEGVRLHDLRHTVASFAASGGASLGMVAALLGHKDTKSTQRYAHLFDAVMGETADRAAGDIHAAMSGSVAGVIPMHRAGGATVERSRQTKTRNRVRRR